jgi:uncharacterized membrane protein
MIWVLVIGLSIGFGFCYVLQNDPMILVWGAITIAALIIQPVATIFGLIIWGLGKLG